MEILKMVLIFFVLQLINVMLNTFKTICTVKSGRVVASLVNAITYGFYSIIVFLTAKYSLFITIPVTIITNLIGVYLSLLLVDKMKKDKLWKITISVPKEDEFLLIGDLEDNGLSIIQYDTFENGYKVIDVFSKSQKESDIVRKIVNKYNVKYIVQENNVRL